ncbi:MAG TPA: protoporphyrinogen oxidase [Acidobacteriaceae bacterium]|jgi:oxygen-dependent protoporphyrinogen oxidase|nr:protoporphyrinogen oxidase [Acidobacteriaceae bacterium]
MAPTPNSPRKIAILGGGIAGLSAAWTLEKTRRAGAPIQYSLYEASGRLGGVIRSEIVDGCVVEGGPDSFLSEKAAAAALCRELGIADQLLPSNDRERKTYILVKNRLIPLPDGLMFMVPTKLIPTLLTPLFSWGTKLHMAREFLFPPAPATEDESVAAMTRRHFGQETVDRLVSPLLSGVYGGNADQLSVRAVLPRMVTMEQKHRSLSRAMLAARKTAAPPRPPSDDRRSGPRSLFTTLRDGMSQMTDRLAAELAAGSVHLSSPVETITRQNDSWLVETAFGRERYDALILALPAWSAGGLLRAVHHELGEALQGVPYSSSITVTAGYNRDDLRRLPLGFGYLVPTSEGRRMLACTFVHNKFANRTPVDKGVLRCFLGGSGNEALLDRTDEQLTAIVEQELAEVLGLHAKPNFIRIARWRQSMAQYGVGHLERMQRVRDAVASLPGLALAGNAYEGIGVPDCIRTGQQAADAVLISLQQKEAAPIPEAAS